MHAKSNDHTYRRSRLSANGNTDRVLVQEVIATAIAACNSSYAPCSRFATGAALLDAGGDMHIGCKVEGASLNVIRAESAALAAMVVSGQNSAVLMAVAGCAENGVPELLLPSIDCRGLFTDFGLHPRLPLRFVVVKAKWEEGAHENAAMATALRLSTVVTVDAVDYALVRFDTLPLSPEDVGIGGSPTNISAYR